MIVHESDIPCFKQLQSIIEEDISNGVYKIGDKLPSENALCRRYGVSRTTVRQALNQLLQKDLVYSIHGKGTFVKIPELNHELSTVVSFANVLQTSGLNGYTKITVRSTKAYDPTAAQYLGQRYSGLSLLGFAKGAPIVYYESFIKDEYRDAVFAQAEELESQKKPFSTYDIYWALGKRISHIHQKLHAIRADDRLAEIFLRPADPPVLIRLDSVYYDENDEPMECKTAYYRADVYSFELKREA